MTKKIRLCLPIIFFMYAVFIQTGLAQYERRDTQAEGVVQPASPPVDIDTAKEYEPAVPEENKCEAPKEDVSLDEAVCPYPSFKTGETVSLDYKDADLSNVLRSLAYSYNLNLVAVKDIKGKVSLTLQGVSIEEALSAILSVNGYTSTRKGSLIYITQGPGMEGIDVATAMVPLEYLTASEASMLLQKVISPRGDIRINDATNSLVITDYPSSIERVKQTLKKIDTAPIQVIIEAKLVDITEKDFENFGVTYSVDYKPPSGGLFDRKTRVQEELAGTQNMAGPSANLTGGQLKITAITFKNFNASVTLDALIQANKAHVLASPAIATLNGKEARIIIGERYPYFEKTQTTTGTIQSTKFADIGTTLRVTPRVSPDGMITMMVHPEVSSLTQALEAGPRIATREADATVRVRDGQTFAIGGLIRREDSRNRGRIPGIGSIPVIGWLFGRSASDMTSTELVVFITPRIVRGQGGAEQIKSTRSSEAVVSIEGVGERAMVNKLWDEARDLEMGEGLESRRKDKVTRMADALDHYKQIASQFPGSEKASNALYNAGRIAFDYFSDLDLAKKMYLQLIDRYTDSPYVIKARKMVERIDKKLAAIEKKKVRNR